MARISRAHRRGHHIKIYVALYAIALLAAVRRAQEATGRARPCQCSTIRHQFYLSRHFECEPVSRLELIVAAARLYRQGVSRSMGSIEMPRNYQNTHQYEVVTYAPATHMPRIRRHYHHLRAYRAPSLFRQRASAGLPSPSWLARESAHEICPSVTSYRTRSRQAASPIGRFAASRLIRLPLFIMPNRKSEKSKSYIGVHA